MTDDTRASFPPTDRSRIRRIPKRAHYDQDTIHAIIDECLVCHVGLVQDGRPVVIPTLHARLDDRLILHGAIASRLLKHVAAGHELCLTFTLLDGVVLARSVFHHSMNYRSVVLFGRGELLIDNADKLRALEALTEHIVPGRWADARRPTAKELHATKVVSIAIDHASAKIRTGPPNDDAEDYALPVWAGVIPVQRAFGPPSADPALDPPIDPPAYLTPYTRP